jgi:hypothetical protein
MIAKGRDGRSGGQGFGGTVRYVLDERPQHSAEEQPKLIGGNMASRDSEALTREFAAVRAQRPEVEKPVQHVSLSFDIKDRLLSDAEMAQIAERYLMRNGYDLEQNQYIVVRHHDKDYQHCHIVANRVRVDGTLTKHPKWDYKHSWDQCRDLEKEFDLHAPQAKERALDRAPTPGEYRMGLDRRIESEKQQLRNAIQEAASGRPTMSEFVRRLYEQRIQVRPYLSPTGEPLGLSYRLDFIAVQGRKLGPGYSWEGVQKHLGVRYDERRDRPALERAALHTVGREPGASSRSRRGRGVEDPTKRPGLLSAVARIRSLVRDPARALQREVARQVVGAVEKLPGGRPVSGTLRTASQIADLGHNPSLGRAVQTTLNIASRIDSRAAVVAKVVGLTRSIANDLASGPDHERTR